MRLVEKLRRIAAPVRAPAAVVGGEGLPGEEISGELGPYWLRRVRLPLRHEHGCLSLRTIRRTSFKSRGPDFSRPEFVSRRYLAQAQRV